MKIEDIVDSVNLAESLDEQELLKIGTTAYEGYMADLGSRKHLEDAMEKWVKLALQVADNKTYPWPGASNVKYPLLATAAMQFAARAYPSLVPSDGNIVKVRLLSADPQGELLQRAIRVGKYMSYQIMDEMEEWEEEMDKLLITLPIVGTVFKKTYWCPIKQRNVSCVVMPRNLVVNYWSKSLEEAERISEIIPMSARKVKERQLSGIYRDVELPSADTTSTVTQQQDSAYNTQPSQADETTPYTMIEQHCYMDLDEDGYAEPYVVVFEETSKTVLRIAPRFTLKDVKVKEDETVVRIDAHQYYTKYGFVPNPDGGFYDIGFGRLLGPINETVDTLLNQLIDAGSMSNLQAGFLGKGLRTRMGDSRFSPGEWKVVNATGQDLKQQIYPLPTREPSMVLFNLLQYLVTAGKELASVADIFVGKMPGQNTPATTTQTAVEQGMKVFTAVYKRVYRSLTKEFRKLYKLNALYVEPTTVVEFLNEPVQQNDFTLPENHIIPAADPSSVSKQEKQAKVQALGQLLSLNVINPMAFAQYYMEAFEIPQPERFLMQPQQGPSPEQQQAELEMQLEQQKAQFEMLKARAKLEMEGQSHQQKLELERELGKAKIQNAAIMGGLKVQEKAMQAKAGMQQQAQQHTLSMATQAQSHQQKMAHTEQQAQIKAKQAANKPKPSKEK